MVACSKSAEIQTLSKIRFPGPVCEQNEKSYRKFDEVTKYLRFSGQVIYFIIRKTDSKGITCSYWKNTGASAKISTFSYECLTMQLERFILQWWQKWGQGKRQSTIETSKLGMYDFLLKTKYDNRLSSRTDQSCLGTSVSFVKSTFVNDDCTDLG